jgi:hypothetical protein
MSWIWPQYLHADLQLSRDQRRAIHRDAWRLWARRRTNILVYMALPVGYLLLVPYASDFGGVTAAVFGIVGPLRPLLRAAAPVVLLVACFVVGGGLLQRFRFAPCVYRSAREHGIDICPKCGYWLRDLPASDPCPECGAPRPDAPAEGAS